jgi:hypothetical protein
VDAEVFRKVHIGGAVTRHESPEREVGDLLHRRQGEPKLRARGADGLRRGFRVAEVAAGHIGAANQDVAHTSVGQRAALDEVATPQGLGIHATNLDVDVGPLLQTQKLLDSVVFARRKGHVRPLTAAELEMLNLTGDGNGYDVLTMPRALREQIPTANLFQQTGYERNSIANRNNTVSKLVAAIDRKMNEEVKLPGAKEMASAYRHLAEE